MAKDVPSVSMRYQVSQIQLIEPGLRKIVAGVADPSPRGCDLNFKMAQLWGRIGSYDQEWADMFAELWEKVSPLFEEPPSTRRVRLRLDCFLLAAAMLAARVSRRLAPAGESKWTLSQLLKRLEVHRKRALRRYVRVNGQRNYAYSSRHWRKKFVRWVRCNVLRSPDIRLDAITGKCVATTPRSALARLHRMVIGKATEVARWELTHRGKPVPPEPELRHQVRLAVRRVRRGGKGIGIPELVHTHAGADYLAESISKRTVHQQLA